jgi:Cu/Ag efflux protein CusF
MTQSVAGCAGIAGAFLALLAGFDTTASAITRPGPPAVRGAYGPLWMAQAQPGETHNIFSGTGVVTAIEPAGTLTINHQAIEGLMGAMEMTFTVNPRALTKGVRPGDKVDFSVDGKTFTIVGLKVRGHI